MHLLLVATVFWDGRIALFSVLSVPFSTVMPERQVSIWFSGDVHCLVHSDWVGMDEISPWTELAVIAAEDQKFPEYWGFDMSAVEKALAYNERHDTHIRGASTLSQQMARNLFLWDGRSWLCKGLEAGLTVSIKTVWSKEWILTVYLNIAESGDGIFDVEVTAQRYFHKPASQLILGEATLLAAILPGPIRYRTNTPSGYVCSHQAWILRQMRQSGGGGFMHEYKLYQRVNPASGLALPLVGRHQEARRLVFIKSGIKKNNHRGKRLNFLWTADLHLCLLPFCGVQH